MVFCFIHFETTIGNWYRYLDTIIKAYKFRLYPNKAQQAYFSQNFGACRFVYNHFLALKIDAYQKKKDGKDVKIPSRFDMSKLLTVLKQKTVDEEGHAWLYDADATALVYELHNLDNAYQNFFRRVKQGGEAPGFPKFKSRHVGRHSYKTAGKNISLDYDCNKIKLPKIGWVKARLHREVEGRVISATISKDSSGRYFVSLSCDGVPAPILTNRKDEVAVEVGVSEIAVLSDGTRFEGPKSFEKLERRLALEQQRLSRMQGAKKGEPKSNRYLKQKKKIAKLHAKIAAVREDSIHKLTRAVVDDYEIIYMRDNDVKGMLENKKVNRNIPRFVEQKLHNHIADASMGELKRIMQYKAQWSGGEVILIDKKSPTTQQCSICGYINDDLADIKGLSIRSWVCPGCGTKHEREINSANNVLAEGRKMKAEKGYIEA